MSPPVLKAPFKRCGMRMHGSGFLTAVHISNYQAPVPVLYATLATIVIPEADWVDAVLWALGCLWSRNVELLGEHAT